MEKINIRVNRSATVYTMGQPGAHIRQFWLVCHGYAQLADEFLNELSVLNDGHTLVVAPEGMNYFYKKGFSGPVGANWMTRQHRDLAIHDNAGYLQEVYNHFLPLLPAHVKIVLLGFSQGTATICRWLLANKPHFHDLVLWAGLPPEDLDYQSNKDYLITKNLYLLYGTNDPFLTEERISTVQHIEDNAGIDFDEQTFQGGHEIPTEELKNLHLRLNKKA